MEYTEYARILDDGNIETTIVDNDEILAMRTSQGFLPLDRMDPPTEILPRGQCYAPRYRIDDGRCVEYWVVVQGEIHPRTISKFKLKLAIAQAGLLSQFTALLAQVEVAPGYMGDEAFADAVTLDEDNHKFADAVQRVKTQFGMTDEQVEEILAASVAD